MNYRNNVKFVIVVNVIWMWVIDNSINYVLINVLFFKLFILCFMESLG